MSTNSINIRNGYATSQFPCSDKVYINVGYIDPESRSSLTSTLTILPSKSKSENTIPVKSTNIAIIRIWFDAIGNAFTYIDGGNHGYDAGAQNVYYSVVFDSNGGSNVPSQTVLENKRAIKPPNPTRENYTFLGWYLNDILFDFFTQITSEIILTARWSYNISPIDETRIVDWSAKIDYSKNIVIEELGDDIGSYLRLAYAEGNEIVDKYNAKNKTEYGAIKIALENKTDTEGTDNQTSFLTANISASNMSGYSLMQFNTDQKKAIDEMDINVTDTICEVISIAGIDDNRYPVAAFRRDGYNPVNLGFDDTNNSNGDLIKGLRQYYGYNVNMYNYGRRITAYVKLTPKDVESIMFPNNSYKDFRGLFKLIIDGETVLCRLEKITDYNPASGEATKCTFIKEK